MRVFSAKRLALLAFALLALLALGAAQGGAELELAEIDDAELDALLSDAEALGLDTGDDVGADAPDEPSGAVELAPETPEEPDEPEPAGSVEPDPEPAGAVEPVPEPDPEPEPARKTPEPVPEKKEKPRPVAAAPAPPPAYKNKGPPPTLRVRLGQEPGACTYCKAAAHKLQVALTHAHFDHHDDERSVETARLGKEKLPEDVFLRHMREVCDDEAYWSKVYASYDFDTGGRVLTGAGLDWSTPNDPRAKHTGLDHARDLKAACKKMESEAEHAGLYHVFWEGREAYTGRKWYFQDAFCNARGHACHPATLEGRDEL
jgi:outer membrane biosynthesis protein TonB